MTDGHTTPRSFTRPPPSGWRAGTAAACRALLPLGAVIVASGCGQPAPPPASDGTEAASTFREGLLPLNGTELFVRRVGTGAPILVVHGGPLLEHGYLAPYLEPLSDDHTLVFFDQRLSGRSAGVVDSASVRIDTLVADMEALRSELGMEEMSILAHSWGGLLALKYALRHPDRVRSMVLVSPMAGSAALWQAEEGELQGRMTDEWGEEARRLRGDPAVQEGDTAAIAALLRHSFRLQVRDPEVLTRLPLYVPTDYLARSRQFGFLMPELADFDLHPELQSLGVPTLLLYGDDEPGSALGGEALAAALPEATLVRVPDAGHFAFAERPEAFQGQVRGFLGGS